MRSLSTYGNLCTWWDLVPCLEGKLHTFRVFVESEVFVQTSDNRWVFWDNCRAEHGEICGLYLVMQFQIRGKCRNNDAVALTCRTTFIDEGNIIFVAFIQRTIQRRNDALWFFVYDNGIMIRVRSIKSQTDWGFPQRDCVLPFCQTHNLNPQNKSRSESNERLSRTLATLGRFKIGPYHDLVYAWLSVAHRIGTTSRYTGNRA